MLFHQLSALVQPPFHGRQRQVEKLRHAQDGHFVKVTQLQHDLKLFRQLRHCLAHVALAFGALHGFGGVLRQFRRVLQNERVHFRDTGLLTPRGILREAEGAVARDGVEP